MRFIYVIPVYNEADQVKRLVEQLRPFLKQQKGSAVWLADNGSTDGTWERVEKLRGENPGLVEDVRLGEKGQGRAFRAAMSELNRRGIEPETRIVFSAADLPFGFSDVECVITRDLKQDLVIGSKAHPRSSGGRGWKRRLMSFAYRNLRFVLLGMSTRDPQGSLIFRASFLPLYERCYAVDFFFTTQLVYFMECEGASVMEIPVDTRPDFRPSRVNPLRDGWRVFKQIFAFARQQGRVPRPTEHHLLPS